MPKTMQAAILVELRQPLVVDEIELPQQLDVGQVLVCISTAASAARSSARSTAPKARTSSCRTCLATRARATVLETGPGVRHVKEGDTVVLHWRKAQGIEATPPRYSMGRQSRSMPAG